MALTPKKKTVRKSRIFTSVSLKKSKKDTKLDKKEEDKDFQKVTVTETEIKNDKGKIERHDVVTEENMCDFSAGDYDPEDKICEACTARPLCIINAVVFGRIVREQVPRDMQGQVNDSLRNKAIAPLEKEQETVSPVKKILKPVRHKK